MSSDSDVARAHALASPRSSLPERAEALALAEAIEARAVREGASVRAVDLHATAAALLERVWRVDGREQDGLEALDLYRRAARDGHVPGACDAAIAGARLAGEVTHDASASYAELYRVERRFAVGSGADGGAPGACLSETEDALSVVAAFRPPQRVLDAIDDGLLGERGAERALAAARAASLEGGAPVPVEPPRIVGIDAWPGRDVARVVVLLNRPATYRIGDEAAPIGPGSDRPRVFLDFDGVDMASAPRDLAGAGLVAGVHAEPTSTGSRIWLDLDGRAWRRDFSLREPYRVVIDVARRPPGASARGARSVARVVLDPGHGGRDTGAVGPTGVKEKDVTLDIAHRAAPLLAAQGLSVILTRDDDRFVSLEERTARANASSADLFVSIHCNASDSRARRGVETYVLDATRDEIAARVAARENATTQAASAELASILGSMRIADQSQRSRRLAQLLERSSTAALGLKYPDVIDGGVHPAGFYVLVGARMPSVLFETSYISNAIEEARLGGGDYRQILADGIANAVRAYREGR